MAKGRAQSVTVLKTFPPTELSMQRRNLPDAELERLAREATRDALSKAVVGREDLAELWKHEMWKHVAKGVCTQLADRVAYLESL